MEKWLISWLGQEKYKMNLECHLVSKNKEILKMKFLKRWGMLKGYRSQPELAPKGQSWNYLNIKINNNITGIELQPKQ